MSMDSKEIYESLLRCMESAKLGLHPTRFKVVKDGRVRVGSKAKCGSFKVFESFIEKIEQDPPYIVLVANQWLHPFGLEFGWPDTIYVVCPELLRSPSGGAAEGFPFLFRFIVTDTEPVV